MTTVAVNVRRSLWTFGTCMIVLASGAPMARQVTEETQERSKIAAANLEDAIVVDCQLPGKLQKLGGVRTYLTPGKLVRLPAVDCRSRGGEYTLGDLSSGTLSLQRWLPLAEQGQAEAQYYVARIYANGMSGVTADHAKAASWYQRASDQNYTAATQELGYLYEQGLGVAKDSMMALNLQRKAANLGDELDYAWKITAAQEEAAQQVAALSEQLQNSTSEIETLRGKVQDTTNAAFKARAELARSESAMLDLREQLQAAKLASTQDNPKIKELQNSLASKEQALQQAQSRMETLGAQLREQQTTLTARMAETQSSSMELNELLASEQAKSRSFEARAAQAEQRLSSSQQELAQLRTQYRAEVEQLVSEREELERAAATAKDSVAALVTARERELARQLLRVSSLEQELANAKKAAATAKAAPGTASSAQTAQAEALRTNLAQLQARYDEQQQQLKKQQVDMASLRTKAEQDRGAVVREMNEQLARRNSELEVKQRRLAAMEAETDTLRSEVSRLNQQRDVQTAGVANDAARSKESLRLAQQKLTEQRERLERLQVEKATEMASLAKARDELQRQLAANRQASEMQVAFLKKDLEARQKDLVSKDTEINRLEQRLEDQSKMFTEMVAQTRPVGTTLASNTSANGGGALPKMRSATPAPSQMRVSLSELQGTNPGRYHAVIIANSNYRYLPGLDTPANDAREIKSLLEQRYGFKAQILYDRTGDEIMTALHEQTLKLTAQDNLLIYYAGHGDADGPKSRAYWLGIDADPDTRKGYLEADHIRAKIKDMQAKHVLLVADSCFSGAITHPKTTTIGRTLNETRLKVQWTRKARMVLTSGQDTPVADSAADPNHSQFARHFIQILRGNLNIMSGEMLAHDLSARMAADPVKVNESGQRQTPTYSALQDANHDVGDFFFVPSSESVKVAGLDW
jgi:hypothetical protein